MEKELGKPTPNYWKELKQFTDARIALGRVGAAIPTQNHLDFQLAHALARDSVQSELNFESLEESIKNLGYDSIYLETKAENKAMYLKRPDLGKILSIESINKLTNISNDDISIIIGDGLSAKAIENQVINFLQELIPKLIQSNLNFKFYLVKGARVAIGDEIGELKNSKISIVLIGERPGLSSPDSMGLYLTFEPRKGKMDSERNCISNIRPEGLNYSHAANKTFYLLKESLDRKISGVNLKDEMTNIKSISSNESIQLEN